MTYKPGVRMVKITTDPKVYAVSKGGVLRWVSSPDVATDIYGADWAEHVDDISDAFFFNYSFFKRRRNHFRRRFCFVYFVCFVVKLFR